MAALSGAAPSIGGLTAVFCGAAATAAAVIGLDTPVLDLSQPPSHRGAGVGVALGPWRADAAAVEAEPARRVVLSREAAARFRRADGRTEGGGCQGVVSNAAAVTAVSDSAASAATAATASTIAYRRVPSPLPLRRDLHRRGPLFALPFSTTR